MCKIIASNPYRSNVLQNNQWKLGCRVLFNVAIFVKKPVLNYAIVIFEVLLLVLAVSINVKEEHAKCQLIMLTNNGLYVCRMILWLRIRYCL